MGGFSESETYQAEIAGVHRLMNQALRELSDTDGLIVDVTLDSGGLDEVNLAIASHIAATPTPVYTKSALGADGIEPQLISVVPVPGKAPTTSRWPWLRAK